MLAPPPFLFILMGFTSMLLQITILRLLLSVFSGNELDIGITLSFWLIYVGFGSYVGKKLSYRHTFWISFILIALLSLPTIIAIQSVRTLLSLAPGEAVSFNATVLSTGLVLLPLCFCIGIQFPLAVLHAGTSNPSGRIYGLESLGAFCGGILFSFIIASRVSAPEVCLALSLMNVAASVYLSKRKGLLLLSTIPILFFVIFQISEHAFLRHGAERIHVGESKSGEISVVRFGSQSSIYINGQLAFTYPDAQTDEMISHFPMTMHPSPKEILLIGGSPGIFKKLLTYPIVRLDFVELDPKIIEYSIGMLSTGVDKRAVNDPRVHIIIQDGRTFIKSRKGRHYDLIILNLPQPSTASINRFYTTEFFREVQSVLKENGILAMRISQSSGYLGRNMQIANGSVFNALGTVFRYVEVTSQEYGMIFSSDEKIGTATDVLEKRFITRGVPAHFFHQYIFRDAFSPFGVDYVRKRLSETDTINTDYRPSAYLYNLMLWSDIHGGKFLTHLLHLKISHIFSALFVLFAGISFCLFRKKMPTISFLIFTTGFAGMSFMVTALLAYQALHGYVYEMLGLLSASFMIGLWVGTTIARKMKNTLLPLFLLDLMIISISLLSVFFFIHAIPLYLTVFTAGILCGAQFSIASLSIGSSMFGGRLYALDLLGSFTGALIVSLIVIPLFGIHHALFIVAVIKTFSALMTLGLRPFRVI